MYHRKSLHLRQLQLFLDVCDVMICDLVFPCIFAKVLLRSIKIDEFLVRVGTYDLAAICGILAKGRIDLFQYIAFDICLRTI